MALAKQLARRPPSSPLSRSPFPLYTARTVEHVAGRIPRKTALSAVLLILATIAPAACRDDRAETLATPESAPSSTSSPPPSAPASVVAAPPAAPAALPALAERKVSGKTLSD